MEKLQQRIKKRKRKTIKRKVYIRFLPPRLSQYSHRVAFLKSESPRRNVPFFSAVKYSPLEFAVFIQILVGSRSSMKKPSGTSESTVILSRLQCQYFPFWPVMADKISVHSPDYINILCTYVARIIERRTCSTRWSNNWTIKFWRGQIATETNPF